MRRLQRLIAASVLVALSSALAGCGSTSSFDPTDLLDFLDTKKKLPGDRKPVFPEGVPGLQPGVPKDLYKGSRQIDDQNAQVATAPAAPPVEEPKAKKGAKSKGKPAPAAAAPAAPAAESEPAASADPDAAPVDQGGTDAAPPAPKPKKIVRKRTTAPPADAPAAQTTAPAPAAQQSAAPFPAPIPSGTFTR